MSAAKCGGCLSNHSLHIAEPVIGPTTSGRAIGPCVLLAGVARWPRAMPRTLTLDHDMSNARTPVPDDVYAEVMFQHDRTCCVCGEQGLAVQIHHIDDNPGNHAINNLAVLCLEHHNQTQTRGGF